MKLRLVAKSNARLIGVRNTLDEFSIETQFAGEPRIFFEQLASFFVFTAEFPMQVAIDPFEFTINFLVADNHGDLIERGHASFPKGLSSVPPEDLHQVVQPIVSDVSKVGGRMPCIGGSAPGALEQSHFSAGLLQKKRRGDAREASPHDDDIHLQVT